MIFLGIRLTIIKQGSLAEMIKKAMAPRPDLSCVYAFGERSESAIHFARLEWAPAADGIGIMGRFAGIHLLPHMPVPLVIVNGIYGAVDRDLMKIRAARSRQLGICIRK